MSNLTSKFKVGDKVRCISPELKFFLPRESVYTVADIDVGVSDYLLVLEELDSIYSYYASRFELVEDNTIKLSKEGADIVVEALENPSEPNEALKDAAKKYHSGKMFEKPFNGKTPKFIHLPNNPGMHFGGGITIAYYEDGSLIVFGVTSCAYNVRYNKEEGRNRSLEVLQNNPQKISIEALIQRYYQIRMFEPTSIEQLMRFLFNAE